MTKIDSATSRPVAGPALVLTTMCAGMFLVLLDVTIVNVALPGIARGLGTGVASLQWVVDGYAVAIAGLLLAGGTLGDRWGHRRVLLIGFAIFAAASVVCAAAPGAGMLIAGRVLQGIGGALLLPSTMAVIAQAFPEPCEQARALGTWAATSSLALPAGPLLGGLLVDTVGWRWVFWINVPLIALVVVGTVRWIPDGRGERTGRLDLPGMALLVVGLGSAVFAVISAGHGGSVIAVVVPAGVVVLAVVGVGAVERRAERPVLPLDLLRRPAFLAPNVVALTMNLVFNGLLFVVTLYLQDVRGLSAVLSGVAVLPLAVPLVLLAPVSGRLTAARGPRFAIVIGCAIAAVGVLGLLGVGRDDGLGWLLAALLVLGCGAGFVTASVVSAVVRATPSDRPGLARGMSNTARQTGTAAGVAVFGAIVGAPSAAGRFVARLHVLGVVGAGLWTLAAVVAVLGIDSHARR